MDQRTGKSPARFLAPLALMIAIVAFLAIVTSSGGGGSSTTGATAPSTATASKTSTHSSKSTTAAKKKTAGKKRFYTVQAGDTLGAIAAKTGIPLATIQSLNPNVDPSAMTTGQKIRLK